jgi:hypothetical protein
MKEVEAGPVNAAPGNTGSAVQGALVGLGLFIAQIIFLSFAASRLTEPISKIFNLQSSIDTIVLLVLVPPVAQWIYVVNICLMKKSEGKTNTALALLITAFVLTLPASLLVLLYGACSRLLPGNP